MSEQEQVAPNYVCLICGSQMYPYQHGFKCNSRCFMDTVIFNKDSYAALSAKLGGAVVPDGVTPEHVEWWRARFMESSDSKNWVIVGKLLADFRALLAALQPVEVVLDGDPIGRCCYGGNKRRSDCASCASWKPVEVAGDKPLTGNYFDAVSRGGVAGDAAAPPANEAAIKLGARLADLLDEDQWAECEQLLIAATLTPPAKAAEGLGGPDPVSIGWAYAYTCNLVDTGIDIRLTECPAMLESAQADFAKHGIAGGGE